MPEKKFGVVSRAVDPGKFGNLVSKKLITEVIEDREKGLSYFKSNFSKRELKVKDSGQEDFNLNCSGTSTSHK